MPGKRRKPGEDERRSLWYRRLGIAELVELLRAGDYWALREFVARHRGLLMSHAQRFGFKVDDARAVATEVLHDVARELIEGRRVVPRSMDGYVVRCFRNRVLNQVRDARRRGEAGATSEPQRDEITPEKQPAGCSEAMVNSAVGPEWEPVPLNPALERLAALLDGVLTTRERYLLSWVSAYVPQTLIATWLGISYTAARKQLERLRGRLAAEAKAHATSLTGQERTELLRFFRRVDAALDESDLNADRRASSDA